MVRTWQDQAPPLFCPSWERALYEGYEMEMHCSNAHPSIYRMGDAHTFVIKGDTRAFLMGDGMGDVPAS
jgi:hypothetical protein